MKKQPSTARSGSREVGKGRRLPDCVLSALSEFLAARMGLHFPKDRWADLERGIAAAAREFGLPDVESCGHWLPDASLAREHIEVLASHLTVGETYFYREKKGFEVLEEHILPEVIRCRRNGERRLRLWSAGCATGEEAYSVAMLIDRMLPDAKEWNITILATDINPQFLRKAAEGSYGEWSFRGTPDWIKERYFDRTRSGRLKLRASVREKVTFTYLNLAEDVYPSLLNNTNAMDVILCRNVLMYFSQERAREVVGKLYRSLFDGGWLIVSPTETSVTSFSPFTAVQFPGAILYRKIAGASHPAVTGAQTPFHAPAPSTSEFPLPREPAARIDTEAPRPAPLKVSPSEIPTIGEAQARQPPPNPAELFVRNARDCANQGRLAEAIAWCEKATAAQKLNPASHYLLATIFQEQGDAQAAALSLARALYIDPGFVLAHFALGNLRLSQGRCSEARRHFTNALKILERHLSDEILPESDGLSSGRLAEIIGSVLSSLPRSAETARSAPA